MAGKGGGSLLEDVGRLLVPQTTQGFLNAPLEKQTRARALDQGNALDSLIQGLSGNQPAQSINVNGSDVSVPAMKMSTQTMGNGAPIGSPGSSAFSGDIAPGSGMGNFMQNQLPSLAMRADPETTLKTLQTRATMAPLLEGLSPEERRLAMIDPKAYAEGKARTMFPTPPEFLTGLKAAGIMPGTPQYDAAVQSWTNKQSGQFDATKFEEDKRHNRATEGTGALVESKDAFGNPVIINKLTGKSSTPSGLQSVGADDVESAAQMIANYNKRPATGAGALRPFNLSIMKRVHEINPDYNEQFYNSSNAARTKFSSGKEGSLVRSANVATSHLETLNALGDALDNGDMKLANDLKNKLSDQFGGVPIAGYEAAAPLVGDEVAKFILGGSSALADREKFAAPLASSRGTASRKAAINSFRGLMVGQLHGLKRQYEAETKSKDFGEKLDPDVAKLLENPQYAPGSNPNAAQPPSGAPSDAKLGKDTNGNPAWFSPDPDRPGKYLQW